MEARHNSDPRYLGDYAVLGRIGKGGMGMVYLGSNPDGTLVALKVVREEYLEDKEFRHRFRREVSNSQKVNDSAHTAAVLDSDAEARIPWLASEFFYGPTLLDILSGKPLRDGAWMSLATGLAQALETIHAADVIHRDLKPSNILLTEDGLKVLDLGIARATESHTYSTLTQTNQRVGTAAYMSPEQAIGDRLSPQSDVFSLGTILFEAGTGRNPFLRDGGAIQTMFAIAQNDPDFSDVPKRLSTVIRPCLEGDPANRPSPAELLTQLQRLPMAQGSWPDRVSSLTRRQKTQADYLRRRAQGTSKRPGGPTAPNYAKGRYTAPTAGANPGDTHKFASSHAGSNDSRRKASADGGASTPPKTPPPNKPDDKKTTPPPRDPLNTGGKIVLSIAAAVLLLWFLSDADFNDSSADSNSPDDGPTTTTPVKQPADNDDDTDPDDDTRPEPELSDIEKATAGDCFVNTGTYDDPDLSARSCDDGMYEVAKVVNGSGNHSRCDRAADLTRSLSYSSYDLTLCLSYRHSAGNAYHAEADDCFYGPPGENEPKNLTDCGTGVFRVLNRFEGTTDTSRCDKGTYYTGWQTFTTGVDELNVLLCTSMIYPDDAGYASVDHCMYRTGSGDDMSFTFSNCSSANAIITGRSGSYGDQGMCGNHGWYTWRHGEYDGYEYTICYRDYP
ncbi:serine/threonine protein kinase [Haloglycomyces albus]|uniref:serine/threonine protein kinase n=1 Tax=Haloglycomyces albus TaxID=526067 RepID=UPI00046D7748|nr:serine/threonine-protein kinase [Haloglycomyces albus]